MKDYDLKEDTSGLIHWCGPRLFCMYLVYKSAHLYGITEPTTSQSRPQQTRQKVMKCTLFLKISRRKSKFRLGAALPFQAQLQPRGLLVAEDTAAAVQEMKCLVRAAGAVHPHSLPPFTALAWFPAPQPVLGLAPHPVEGWSCGIVNQSLVPAGHRLPPPAQQPSLLAHCSSQPWALQKLHFHPACWLTYSPFASVGNMFDLLKIHSSYLHGPQWSLQT